MKFNLSTRIVYLLIFLAFLCITAAHAEWVSPTGSFDPASDWVNDSNAYDDNISTYATDASLTFGWGSFIELTLNNSIECNKVRVFADYVDGLVDAVDIDVSPEGGTWIDKYVGPVDNATWDIIGITLESGVRRARFRWHYLVSNYYFWLYEFDFWNYIIPVVTPSVETMAATSTSETRAILHGRILFDGEEPCQYRFEYGPTVSYGNATAWTGVAVTNDTFSEIITGLNTGETYHYRAQATNEAIMSSGDDMTFTTGTVESGWMSPFGFSDPDSAWGYEMDAADDELCTYAKSYHDVGDPDWGHFVIYTIDQIYCDKVRYFAKDVSHVDLVDIDVYNGSDWIDVQEGVFTLEAWIEHSFPPQVVTQARIRFHVDGPYGFFFHLNEFDFHKFPTPTIKTIKPGGGGDFELLQTWENWADDQSNANQWAECYTGGDLGEVVIAGWAATPDSTHYPRIYTPLAERHNGKDEEVGAYIDNSSGNAISVALPYVRVEGLRIEMSGTSNNAILLLADAASPCDYPTIDSNLLISNRSAAGGGAAIKVSAADGETLSSANVRNNLIYGKGTQQYGIEVDSTAASIVNAIVQNNTIHQCAAYGYYGHTTGSANMTVENNISTSSGTQEYTFAGSVTSNNNLSSDDSADDAGGSGNLINKSAFYQYVNPDNDLHLINGANALNAGVTIESFDWDALHGPTDHWRPQGSAWDMGALEGIGDYRPVASFEPISSQYTDGSGYVSFEVLVWDVDNEETRLKIQYSTDGGATWGDPWILSATQDAGAVSLNNAATYEVGNSDPKIGTDNGTREVTMVWDTKSASNEYGSLAGLELSNVKLRAQPNDFAADGFWTTSETFSVDNREPLGLADFYSASNTLTSITWGWTAVTLEAHFNHYEIWYGTIEADVINRGGTAYEWDPDNDPALTNMSTTETTITGLSSETRYYGKIWAVDDLGNEATTLESTGIPTESLVVVNTNDSGLGSLRWHIDNANSQPGYNKIIFDIPLTDPGYDAATGAFTIRPVSALPALTDNNTDVDATTQVTNQGNTNPNGPEVIINGSNAGNVHGLRITGSHCTIEGLGVNGFSASSYAGVYITGGNNHVQGNYIGTTATGEAAKANYYGIYFNGSSATRNVIGGITSEARNIISCNTADGIYIYSAPSNEVKGNYIGTDKDGNTNLGNGTNGIRFGGTASDSNLIGTSESGGRNVISGNGEYGIYINPGNRNRVLNNYIGTDVNGAADLGNVNKGIMLAAGCKYNIIGGTTANARNIVSGNDGVGIGLYGSGNSSNEVIGNYVGTDATGTTAIGNSSGIYLQNGVQFNLIGNTAAGAGNLVSGNLSKGIVITDTNTNSNEVRGNYIGTNASGTAALQNTHEGVKIESGPRYNIIGGTVAGARNIISGNGYRGVSINSSNTRYNEIKGNYIGTDVTGTVGIGNGGDEGVYINSASFNIIGGDASGGRNTISYNRYGIYITGTGTNSNEVRSNYIGTTATGEGNLGNDRYGIYISSSAQYNRIGRSTTAEGSTIAYNGTSGTYAGIYITGTLTDYNTISRVSMFGNTGLGIDLASGGNDELRFPTISSAKYSVLSGLTMINGTCEASVTSVEVYKVTVPPDPSGYGEGRNFLGATTASGGNWSIYVTGVTPLDEVTAINTDNLGNTSEFSHNFDVTSGTFKHFIIEDSIKQKVEIGGTKRKIYE
ncbi:MAG: hypothetical protein KKB81_02270 [Candidatus Margulisbacteria bacterium]|nr:hypothetical protein [Candidatus Margulisiibacteriota bacterium]MBU1022608.1 hypothetical protein [Candidatus Margulisiibacteriota bacterium]MBU1728894.1 hypothetical protein [Candidatus Margulisiibacteriota bacterium]MBU1955526.1 hypothetical protein [Candidatus Margulisiibacteriota bacterium]